MANITMTASVLAVSLSFAMMSFRPYLRFATVEKDRVTLQEGEITAFQWVTKNALLSMKKEELATKRMQKFIDKWERAEPIRAGSPPLIEHRRNIGWNILKLQKARISSRSERSKRRI